MREDEGRNHGDEAKDSGDPTFEDRKLGGCTKCTRLSELTTSEAVYIAMFDCVSADTNPWML